MYWSNLWAMVQTTGFGSGEDANKRWRFLLDQGLSDFIIEYDLPTTRALEIRDAGIGRFIDIRYQDIQKDPVKQIRPIYEFAGMKLTHEVMQSMLQWNRDHSRDKRPRHHYHYTLEQFGFTRQSL